MKTKKPTRLLNIRSWKFSFKINSIIVLMMITMVILITVLSRHTLRRTITEQVGNEFENTARGINISLGEYLMVYINQMATLTMDSDIQADLRKHLQMQDRGETGTIIPKENGDNRTANKASSMHLKYFASTYSDFLDIVITNNKGEIISTSGAKDNYFDEESEWLVSSWNEGEGGFFIGDPHFDQKLNAVTMVIAFPVYDNNEGGIIGIIRAEIQAQNILFFLEELKIGETGRAFLVDVNGNYLVRKNQFEQFKGLQFLSKNIDDLTGNGIIKRENGDRMIYGFSRFKTSFIKNIPEQLIDGYTEAVHDLSWYIVFVEEEWEALLAVDVTRRSILFTSIISIIIFVVIIALIIRIFLRPLYKIFNMGERVMEGDYSGVIETKATDEIGRLAVMFNELVGSMREMSGFARRIADGDLSVEVSARSEKDEMGKAFEKMTGSLRKQIGEINKVVSILTSSNAQLASTVSEISASSNETVTTVSEVSATIDEVKQTSEVASQKAKNVADTANRSVQISEKGIRSTEDSIVGMEHIREQVMNIADTIIKLSEQSKTIGEITNAVNELAEQSNLLAVNASIEAAKAGEYGKGFGVVAREIRTLADQSKQSTHQINNILVEVQKTISSAVMATERGGKAVDKGMELAETSGDSISVLADSISEAAQSSSLIAASSHQQLAGLKELTNAMDNIRNATEQNAAGNKDIEKAVTNLKETINNLNLLTSRYIL